MLKEKKSDDNTWVIFLVLALFLLLGVYECFEYAKYGWDQVLAKAGAEHVGTVKTVITVFFVIATVFVSIMMLVSLKFSYEDEIKMYFLSWLIANSFHLAVIFCVWTGLISYWIINVLLVPLVLLQGLLVFGMTMASRFEDLMKGYEGLHTATILGVFVYHLFFPGILIARVVYRFGG